MADPKGAHLFVNLSATETRRRLKGFGHGVRKIQSAGKNQAVIIHTATGQHLIELQDKFSDVGYASEHDHLGEPIENVRNLGGISGRWLREIGVGTRTDLERIGPILAYRLVKRQQSTASLNLLWALAAGLQNRDWRELKDSEKQLLLDELTR